MSRGRKIGIGLAAALVTAAVVGIGVFYCIFFPDPLAKRIAPVNISVGEMSATGESNVLIAYFSIATSRALGLGSGPEQIAAACPGAEVADGLSARSEEGVKGFLKRTGLAIEDTAEPSAL